MQLYYVPVCSCCGKQGLGGCCRTDGAPKSNPPSMPGTCPSSPTKKHMPKWEIDYSHK